MLLFFVLERIVGDTKWSSLLMGLLFPPAPKFLGAILTDWYFELCDDDMLELTESGE